MKKVLKTIVMAIIIFMLVISSFSYGVNEESIDDLNSGITQNHIEEFKQEGSTATSGKKPGNPLINIGMGPIRFLLKMGAIVILLVPEMINEAINSFVSGDGHDRVFTIQEMLANEYPVLDIRYIVQPLPKDTEANASLLTNIRENTSIWYVALRNVSLIGITLILVYIGIRMAIATVSQEKAKYKVMFIDWLKGLCILFILHYLIVFAIFGSAKLVDFLRTAIDTTDYTTIEGDLMNHINTKLFKANGMGQVAIYFIEYSILLYLEIKFFFMYLRRMLKVMFLIIISPIVCLTYSLDTIQDGKPQAFNNWISEFTVLVFIQPLQLLAYILMIVSAKQIMVRAPILSIIFILGLSKTEKIIRNTILSSKASLTDSLESTKIPVID